MNHPFDEFSKSLSDSVPRRELLRRLGAIVTGAILGPLALGEGSASAGPDERLRQRGRRRPASQSAACRENVRKKDRCAAFCNGLRTKQQRAQCLTVCRSCNNDPRRLKGSSGNYVCCGSGQTYCRGACVDLKNDSNNCGGCGRTCSGGKRCVNGTCTGGGTQCPSGQTRCGTTCVSTATDNSNCGACGNVCSAGTTCTNGTCTGSGDGCFGGQVRCNGICREISLDPSNCGGCGVQCGPGQYCAGGVCNDVDGGEAECPGGATKCNDLCTNTAFDPQNCGGCGIVCAAGETCSGGICQDNF